MATTPRRIADVAERQRRLIEAMKAYGVYEPEHAGSDGKADWLAAHFVAAWLEAWRKRNYPLMGRYLEQANEVLFDRIFGQGQNSVQAGNAPAIDGLRPRPIPGGTNETT